jgi:MFS family permease
MAAQQHPSSSHDLNPSKQSIWGLNFLLFFIADVRHGIGPLLSIYLRSSLGWNAAKIGLALALAEIGGFISQIPAGLLADASRSKRSIIAVACCIIILGCLVFLFLPSLPSILLTQLMMGISIALIPSAIGAITLGLFGRKKLPVRVSKNEVWNHAGNLLTTLTIGLVSYSLGNLWIFYIFILFSLASMISLSFIRPSEIHYKVARELVEVDPETHHKASSPIPIWELLKRKPILVFNLSLILYYLSNGAQMTMLGQMLTNQNPAYSALFISGGLMIAECTMIVVASIMSLIVNLFGRKIFLLTAFSILSIRAILYTLVREPSFLLSIQILDGTAAGILGVMGTVINSDLAIGTGRFNFLQGMGNLSTAIGEAMSQIMGGLIAYLYGFNMSFFVLASIAILGATFFWLFMPETKNIEAK